MMHQHVDETKGLNWKRVIASSSCAQVLNLMLLLVLTTCWASLMFRILPNSGPLMACVWNQGSNSGCWTPAAKTPVTPSSRFTFISSNLFSQRIKVNKLKMLSGLNLRRTFTTTPASQHKKKICDSEEHPQAAWGGFSRRTVAQHSHADLGTLTQN